MIELGRDEEIDILGRRNIEIERRGSVWRVWGNVCNFVMSLMCGSRGDDSGGGSRDEVRKWDE